MKAKVPTNREEALAVQIRLERLYQHMRAAHRKGKSLEFREALADQYIRLIEAMTQYKRNRRDREHG